MHRSIGLFVFATITAFLLTIMLVPAQSTLAYNTFFNFDGYGVGTAAEAIASPGIQMSSQWGSGNWQVTAAEKFQSLSGNVLSSPACNDSLVIKLDSYKYTIGLRFAAWGGASGIRVQGFAGGVNGTMVQTQIHYGSPNGISEGMYEGSLEMSMDGADTIVISDVDGCVAIDDVRLNDMEIIVVTGEILVNNPRIPVPQPLPLPGPIVVEPIIVQPVVIRGN